jgi:hypothetical protein
MVNLRKKKVLNQFIIRKIKGEMKLKPLLVDLQMMLEDIIENGGALLF